MKKNHLIFKTDQIQAIEKKIFSAGIFSPQRLMELAAKSVIENLILTFGKPSALSIFCGRGNNGADGYLCSIISHEMGIPTTVIETQNDRNMAEYARLARDKCKKNGIKLIPFNKDFCIDSGIIIDALVGSGLRDIPRDETRDIIEFINKQNAPIVSIDVPSGVTANSGHVHLIAVKADLTICMIALKPGLTSGEAKNYCGKVIIEDFGIKVDDFADTHFGELLEINGLLKLLPERRQTAHKYNSGICLVVGGDYGFGGAPMIVAEGSMRVGAGLTRIVTRPAHVAACLSRNPECLVNGVESIQEAQQFTKKVNAVVIGPGLGKSSWSEQMLKVFLEVNVPIILDADALNLISDGNLGSLLRNKRTILTPHSGEAARLLGCTTKEIDKDRFSTVRELQKIYGGTVLLKGSGSLLCSDQSDKVFVCPYGNPSLATAGSGDLLSGMIGGFISQGLSDDHRSVLGLLIHSFAANVARYEKLDRGMIATDLLEYIRRIINSTDAIVPYDNFSNSGMKVG